jgi:hypothetical protein
MDGSVPRRFRRLVVGATVVLCSVALIPVSVLLLMVVSRSAQVDWNQLSDVSQALGIASALLSGAALIAVAISIRLQSQQTRIMQFQSLRMMRLELLNSALENERHLAVWGYAPWASPEEIKTRAYFASVFSYYQISFALGAFPEEELRLLLGRAFMSEDVRNAWRDIRLAYTVSGWPHEFQRFAEIVDQERERVLASTREGTEDVADSGAVGDGQP